MRRLPLLPALLALAALLASSLGAVPASAQPEAPRVGPVVEVFEASGVIDASLLGALQRDLAAAGRRDTEVFLIQLDSFGSLSVDPAAVQRAVAGAQVPVAVWLGPRSARAGGAAAFLLAAADVVAVSRQARVGPALPAQLGRGREPQREQALFDGSGLPAQAAHGILDGAAAEAAGVADYQAESLPDAVKRLDGRRVEGETISIPRFQVRFLSRSLVDRVRHGLANPSIAYLLLLAAAACLAFEWFQPGFGVAGVAGLVMALLAVYALAVLPTNWLALAVLVAGFGVFTLDTAVGGLGLGTATATALTAAGSWWLFSSPNSLLRVDGRLAAAGVAWSVLYFVVILTVVLRSQRQLPAGTEALVGAGGVVRSMLNPGGIVVVEGAMWRAVLDGGGALPTGQRVKVDAVRDGILQVTAEDPAAVRPGKPGRVRRAAGTSRPRE
ncbi:MAG TPA: NfeD family protein [Actinomycetes bacterium]|jgi:membrane-bound serine protease (ClpP class)|nr:NfeD family protein [Actinomycetes bacterium]